MRNILAPEPDAALDADVRHKVVHPVQGLEEGGFAAARGADEGSDLLFAHVQRDALEGLEVAVPEVQIFAEMTGILLSIKYPLLFLFELCFCQTGCEVDEKHQNQQHCADAPGGGEVAILEGPQIEQDGEGRALDV